MNKNKIRINTASQQYNYNLNMILRVNKYNSISISAPRSRFCITLRAPRLRLMLRSLTLRGAVAYATRIRSASAPHSPLRSSAAHAKFARRSAPASQTYSYKF